MISLLNSISFPSFFLLFICSGFHLSKGTGPRILHGERLSFQTATEICKMCGWMRQSMLCRQNCSKEEGKSINDWIPSIYPFIHPSIHRFHWQLLFLFPFSSISGQILFQNPSIHGDILFQIPSIHGDMLLFQVPSSP